MNTSKKVLIADDNKEILALTTTIASTMGFEPIPCKTSREAMIYLSSVRQAPRLVITDYDLGESQTGADIAREVRVRFGTPVIVMTGNLIDENLITLCMADGYIAKPFNVRAMMDLIGDLLLSKEELPTV